MANVVRMYLPEGKYEDFEETLSLERCRELVGGYVELHSHGGLSVVCDEEGVLKCYDRCICLNGVIYYGPVLVGKFGNKGMCPVTPATIKKFERNIIARY